MPLDQPPGQRASQRHSFEDHLLLRCLRFSMFFTCATTSLTDIRQSPVEPDRVATWRTLRCRFAPFGGLVHNAGQPPGFPRGAQFARVAGSPNRGKMLLSKRVMAQIRVPERVRTISPTV